MRLQTKLNLGLLDYGKYSIFGREIPIVGEKYEVWGSHGSSSRFI